MNQYVGKVLDCTRRKDGDVETYICTEFDVVSRRYTLVPTFGRLCRQHLVTLGQGGWSVVASRDDQAQIKKTIADLHEYTDPFNLGSERTVASKNQEALKRLLKPTASPLAASPFAAFARLMAFNALIKQLASRACKFVFIEMPADDADADMGGEYIVLEESEDSLYCISTVDCNEALDLARIRIRSKNPDDKTATVLRTYEDKAYLDRFIGKLKDFAGRSQGSERDRAENIAAQLERAMNRVYPKQAKPSATSFVTMPDNHHESMFGGPAVDKPTAKEETKRSPLADLVCGTGGNPFGLTPAKRTEEVCCDGAKTGRFYGGLL